MTTLRDTLRRLDACSEAVEWVGDRTLAQAWAECHRVDWMLWLVGRTGAAILPELLVAITDHAMRAAEPVSRDLECWPEVVAAHAQVVAALRSGDHAALRAAESVAWNAASAAMSAAWSAASAAGAAYAASAANAAWSATYATYAANAAWIAAQRDLADLVRAHMPHPPEIQQ